MDNNKNDIYYLSKMIKDLAFICKNMDHVDYGQFLSDEILQDSMMFRLIQISESAGRLSEGMKNADNTVPWRAIYGLRNRIVHDYGNVDLSIVFETLTNDIPSLYALISRLKWKE